ncbi:SET domain-containing protein, partial [Zopfia rhizophila CBS 207.26]
AETEYYKVLPIPGKGYGCIALKSIKRGTRILADSPLLILEKAHYFHADIQAEFDKLSPADKKLYFTLHSAHNQDPSSWPRKIADSVTDRESKRIEEQHNARVGKEPTLISIFQTNCMEKDGGAAVFPNAARFNHSCNPNACFTWNSAIGKETIHTMKDIKADEEITLGYCDTTHDKATRRWELKHYGFFCDCLACTGDESDPDSFAAKSAARRFRLMELEQEMEPLRGVFLELGAKKEGFVNQLLELAKLLIEEGDYTARLAATYLDIALICEVKGDLAFAKVAAQKALQVCIDSQGRDFLDVPKYESVVKRIKEKMDMEGEMNGSIEKK